MPRWLQVLLWNVYRPGQEIDKQPSRLYMLVQSRCRVAMAQAESRVIAEPMSVIRALAATSKARALHNAINGLADREALVALDAELPRMVRRHLERRAARPAEVA